MQVKPNQFLEEMTIHWNEVFFTWKNILILTRIGAQVKNGDVNSEMMNMDASRREK